jgi:hypothetical protein
MNQTDLLATDAVNTFLVDFGESIVFLPYRNSPINMMALVYRQTAISIPGLSGAGVNPIELQIANDSVAGVTVVNKGKDKVILSDKVGGNNEEFTVIDIIQNDQGFWHLSLK